VRLSGFTPDRIVPPRGRENPPSPQKKEAATVDAVAELNEAREAFRRGQYDQALKLARSVASRAPETTEATKKEDAAQAKARDAEVQQFLALIYFALAQYEDAFSAAHAALHHGGHWDWKTLSGHYAATADYSSQLRALEASIRESSTPEKRFLVGYHYWMLGQAKAARAQFALAAQDKPDDKLIAELLQDLNKENTND
ncbi:MAG: hypothetical protein HYV60_21495, partial [Planctomycetia bacterium]|nr:hypothetical protein [Planctomycetia bacterium]